MEENIKRNLIRFLKEYGIYNRIAMNNFLKNYFGYAITFTMMSTFFNRYFSYYINSLYQKSRIRTFRYSSKNNALISALHFIWVKYYAKTDIPKDIIDSAYYELNYAIKDLQKDKDGYWGFKRVRKNATKFQLNNLINYIINEC